MWAGEDFNHICFTELAKDSEPHGPVLIDVEGDRGLGQFHRECETTAIGSRNA
jgi:hypothetical protein